MIGDDQTNHSSRPDQLDVRPKAENGLLAMTETVWRVVQRPRDRLPVA